MKRSLSGLIVVLLLAVVISPAVFIPWDRILETRILGLLPETADTDDARIARELIEGARNRILLAILAHPEELPLDSAAVRAFEESLATHPAIEHVKPHSEELLRDAAGVIHRNRFSWLLPGWLDTHFPGWESDAPPSAIIAARVVEELEAFLEDPASYHAADVIPHDPFLLVPGVMEDFPAAPRTGPPFRKLYWINQKESPLEPAGQAPVFEALAHAHGKARDEQPDLVLDYTGVAPFAHASRTRIQAEVTRLNLMTFLFVLAIISFFVRQTRLVLLLVALMALALAAALFLALAVFQSVHILTLVIGAILVGVAIDYGLHIFLHEPSPVSQKHLLRPLLTGAVSTAGGFAFLLLSKLPLLNQVGAFTVCGLIAALFFGLLLKRLYPDPVRVPLLTPRFRPYSLLPSAAALPLILLAAVAVFNVSWHDDIRELDYPHPELHERDRMVRDPFTPPKNNTVDYLVVGPNPAETRVNLGRWLGDDPGDAGALGALIPLQSRSEAAWELFRSVPFLSDLRDELEADEYELDAFSPFETDWAAYMEKRPSAAGYNRQVEDLAKSLPTPLSILLHVEPGLTWILVRREATGNQVNDLPPFVQPVRQLETLNASFALYRKSSTRLILAGSIVLAAIVFLVYRKQTCSCLLRPVMAAGATLGAASLFFEHLNLFHLIGLFLGTCIALDYALFATEQRRAGGNLPASVPLSALTTFGVFGILATSAIPAVKALGFTVACTILFAFLLTLVKNFPSAR